MARRWYVMETCREDVRREDVLQAGLQLSGMRGRYVQERVILPLQYSKIRRFFCQLRVT